MSKRVYSVYRDDRVQIPVSDVIKKFGVSISESDAWEICCYAESKGHWFKYDLIGRYDNKDDAIKACKEYPACTYTMYGTVGKLLIIDFAMVEEENWSDDLEDMEDTLEMWEVNCAGIELS